MRASRIRVQCELMNKSLAESFVIIDLPSSPEDEGEPLQSLLVTLAQLPVGGLLKLRAAKRPDVLIESLQNRNYDVQVRQWQTKTWDVEVRATCALGIDDLRELEAPVPMEKVLIACSKLGADDLYLARLPRVPVMLFPHLEVRGLQWQVHEEVDQSALLLVRKPA